MVQIFGTRVLLLLLYNCPPVAAPNTIPNRVHISCTVTQREHAERNQYDPWSRKRRHNCSISSFPDHRARSSYFLERLQIAFSRADMTRYEYIDCCIIALVVIKWSPWPEIVFCYSGSLLFLERIRQVPRSRNFSASLGNYHKICKKILEKFKTDHLVSRYISTDLIRLTKSPSYLHHQQSSFS